MRKFYDENGKWVRSVAIPFEEIPEEFIVKSIKLDKFKDLSYLGIIKHLSEESSDFKEMEMNDEKFIGEDILSHLSMDYLQTAIQLRKSIVEDRMKPNLVVSYYVIPCLFCCRHAIELKLKQCIFKNNNEKANTHNIKKLWDMIKNKTKSLTNKIESFIYEINEMDENEIVMRYGLDKNLKLLKEKYMIDVDVVISNTMYLFNEMAIERPFMKDFHSK